VRAGNRTSGAKAPLFAGVMSRLKPRPTRILEFLPAPQGAGSGRYGQAAPLAIRGFQLVDFALIGIEVIVPIGKASRTSSIVHRAFCPLERSTPLARLNWIDRDGHSVAYLVGDTCQSCWY
jgi:hypothetical protein